MFCALLRPRYQVSVYRTIGPLVISSICLVHMNVLESLIKFHQ